MFKVLCNSTLKTKVPVFLKGGRDLRFLAKKNQGFSCQKLNNFYQSTPLQMVNQMRYPTFSTLKDQCWEEEKYNLPDFMKVSGTASGQLPSEQVIIEFVIETLSDSAGTSLLKNNQIVSEAISLMKSNGIEENELSTQNLKIFPSYQDSYNNETKNYDKIFLGYIVENKLRFISKKMELTGKVIDIAVSSGINKVSSVVFQPSSSKIKELKDSLIAAAIEDATTRAKLAVVPLGYEIKEVKSIELDSESNDHSEDPVYLRKILRNIQNSQSTGNFTISLNVSFIIDKAN